MSFSVKTDANPRTKVEPGFPHLCIVHIKPNSCVQCCLIRFNNLINKHFLIDVIKDITGCSVSGPSLFYKYLLTDLWTYRKQFYIQNSMCLWTIGDSILTLPLTLGSTLSGYLAILSFRFLTCKLGITIMSIFYITSISLGCCQVKLNSTVPGTNTQ